MLQVLFIIYRFSSTKAFSNHKTDTQIKQFIMSLFKELQPHLSFIALSECYRLYSSWWACLQYILNSKCVEMEGSKVVTAINSLEYKIRVISRWGRHLLMHKVFILENRQIIISNMKKKMEKSKQWYRYVLVGAVLLASILDSISLLRGCISLQMYHLRYVMKNTHLLSSAIPCLQGKKGLISALSAWSAIWKHLAHKKS